MDYWRELAHGVGLKGLHLVGLGLPPERVGDYGFDASSYDFVHRVKEVIPRSGVLGDLQYRFRYRKFIRKPVVYTYKEVMPYLLREGQAHLNEYPSVVPNWDNTPRAMFSGLVYHESTPELYRQHLRQALEKVMHKPQERRVIFIKSWNEWGEGNYLEPELRYGREYLEVTRDEVCGKNLKGRSPDLEAAQSLHWS
jgi:hypothetical protein